MAPSVTRILSPWGDFSKIPPAVLENASARGTRVHLACSNYASGFMVPDMAPDEQLYFNSFKRWFDATIDEVISIEREYRCDICHFCGHPDLLCILKGDNESCVIDLKTPRTLVKSWRLQVAAYSHLTKSARGGTLRLSPEGNRAIFDESATLEKDLAVFLNCLTAWRFFNE